MPKVSDKDHLQDAMATALSLDHWTAPNESLCDYDVRDLSVNFLCMDQAATKGGNFKSATSLPQAARFQEIFMDLVGWHASQNSSSRFLLDERFGSILSENEKQLKERILVLMKSSSSVNCEALSSLTTLLEQNFGFQKLDTKMKQRVERLKGMRTMACTPSNVAQEKEQRSGNEATFIIKQIIEQMRIDNELRNAAALVDVNPSRPIQIKAFFREKLPSYSEKIIPSLQAATDKVNSEFFKFFQIPSHVFVCNTSVCELACDAFLCPVSISKEFNGRIWTQWRKHAKMHKQDLWSELSDGERVKFDRHPIYKHVAVIRNWPNNTTHPLVLPTESSTDFFGVEDYAAEKHVNLLMESVWHFLNTAYELVKDKPPLNRRGRHLFALPVVGTGGGGAVDLTGEVVRNLLNVLSEFVADHQVDCVVVAADEATYAHAQTVRAEPKSILNTEKIRAAIDLAKLAASGHLSLFLGAGTSMASGLPSWIELLHQIEDKFTQTGTKQERRIGDHCSWDPLRMADELERIAETKRDRSGLISPLKERVSAFLEGKQCHPSLVLTLLLSLPIKSVVTTNYDKLIETAYRNRNIAENKKPDLSVLPYNPVGGAQVWLLKMHGCVSHPDRLVLSGKDYAQRKILSGIVQANLLTTHLLFCGFSLSDPNYLAIIREVRAALHPCDMTTCSTFVP